MLLHAVQPGDAPPCQRLRDGRGVYVALGDAFKPFETYTLICPGRHPEIYHRTAPLSLETEVQMHPEITGAPHTMLLHVLVGLHREGIRELAIDTASADRLFFQSTGIERIAAAAQIPVPPGISLKQLTSEDAYLLRQPIRPGEPEPCGRFPDGTGLFVIRGDPMAANPAYRCPR